MSSEAYRRVVPTFWSDPDVKRPLSRDQKLLALYFFTSPHSNMIGLYYCPLAYVAAETDLTVDEIRRALVGPLSKFVTYDEETEEVFVYRLAKHNIGDELKMGKDKKGQEKADHRIAGVRKLVLAAHSKRLVRAFLERYGTEYQLGMALPDERETPSKPLASPFEAKAVAVAVAGTQHNTASQELTVPSEPTGGRLSVTPIGAEPIEEVDPNTLSPNDRRAIGDYLNVARKVWWGPDKKPPTGWTDRREAHVYLQRRKKGESHDDLIRMIHGARYLVDRGEIDWEKNGKPTMKPGDKLTGRLLNNTHDGARDFGSMALDAYGRIGEAKPPPKNGKGAGVTALGESDFLERFGKPQSEQKGAA